MSHFMKESVISPLNPPPKPPSRHILRCPSATIVPHRAMCDSTHTSTRQQPLTKKKEKNIWPPENGEKRVWDEWGSLTAGAGQLRGWWRERGCGHGQTRSPMAASLWHVKKAQTSPRGFFGGMRKSPSFSSRGLVGPFDVWPLTFLHVLLHLRMFWSTVWLDLGTFLHTVAIK